MVNRFVSSHRICRCNGPIRRYLLFTFTFSTILTFISLAYYAISYCNNDIIVKYHLQHVWRVGKPPPDAIKMAVSACGSEILEQTIVLLKSAIALSKSHIHFIILTDYLALEINNSLQQWPPEYLRRISYEVFPIQYPGITDPDLWKGMYRSCSTERLFLTEILNDTDALLYIDADTLLLDSIENLWSYFSKFNEKQIIGIAPELDHPQHGYFRVHFSKKVPIYGRSGVNAGVLVMNLTRMRQFNWREQLEPIYRTYRKVVYADQGIINIIFNRNPDRLYLLPCRWNYCDELCLYGTEYCKSAETDGVAIHHHTGLHNDRDKTHHATYRAFRNYKLGTDLRKYLLEPMKSELTGLGTGLFSIFSRTECTKNPEIFYKSLERTIDRIIQ